MRTHQMCAFSYGLAPFVISTFTGVAGARLLPSLILLETISCHNSHILNGKINQWL